MRHHENVLLLTEEDIFVRYYENILTEDFFIRYYENILVLTEDFYTLP
jgi:hypothetical protein